MFAQKSAGTHPPEPAAPFFLSNDEFTKCCSSVVAAPLVVGPLLPQGHVTCIFEAYVSLEPSSSLFGPHFLGLQILSFLSNNAISAQDHVDWDAHVSPLRILLSMSSMSLGLGCSTGLVKE